MKRGIIISIVVLALGIVLIFIISSPVDPGERNVSQSENDVSVAPAALRPAPQFSLKNYNGETVSFADFSGKTLVVNSWAAWCLFCGKELVDFAAVQKELGDQVVFIAIDRAESLKVARKYTDELGVTDEMVFLLDPSDSFYRSISGFSMPETIFVDRDGMIRIHKRGPMDASEIREKVQSIL